MRHILKCFFLALVIWFPAIAQLMVVEDNPPTHNDQGGGTVVVSMSGLGIGGFYRKALPGFWTVGVNGQFFLMRGDKEIEFIDPYYGIPVVLNKYSQLFLIPVNLEIKKRLFANDIEDNFRPHVMLEVGAILGINVPDKQYYAYFNLGDPKTEYQVTYNFVIGFGVDVISHENFFVSVRPQYRYVYFPHKIAFKKDHSAFEINLEFGANIIPKNK